MVRVRKIVRKQQLSGCTPACTQNFQKNLKPNAGAAYSGFFDRAPGHQNSAPNCSQLGVFICGFRPSRGAPGHSACASSSLSDRHHAPGSPLFRPIFSRNLRQLLRRGTRRRRCSSTTCARADANGCLAGLHEQCRTANPRGQHPRQPLGGNGSSP